VTQAPDDFHLQRSSRDPDAMASRLRDWLAEETGGPVEVRLSGGSDANGMSSDTLLADVAWAGETGAFVLRLAPSPGDVPVFRSYRLDHQYDVLRLVGRLTAVPVPEPRWLEPTGAVLGAPFFLMERINGLVPPDVMPYPFGDNWLFDASPEQQRALQEASVGVLGRLHSIPRAEEIFGFLDRAAEGATPLRRHVQDTRDWYAWAAADLGSSPLVERALAWLEREWPAADRPDNVVLSWGDARIGNVLYRDFAPVAVLDWEMAGLGPREIDLGWMVFAHRVFQGLAEAFELPGMPDFLRVGDVRSSYLRETGVEVGDLTWFEVYAAVIWAVVFLRTGARQVHFGEIPMPQDVEALFHHRPLLAALLDEVGA
jgi:aminoglycoside phosphotransferase (APT) family kinase protein